MCSQRYWLDIYLERVESGAQLVEHLLSKHEALGWIPRYHISHMWLGKWRLS